MNSLQMRSNAAQRAALTLALLGAACSTSPSHEESRAETTRQAITTARLTYQVPNGANEAQVMLSGSQRLLIYDRVTLGTAASQVAVLGGGLPRSEFAAGSRLNGSAWITGNVFMGSGATITRNLRAAGLLDKQAGASVLGQTVTRTSVPVTTRGWDVELPDTYPNEVILYSGTSSAAGPGAYSTINVSSNATLKVSSGNYFIQTLTLESQGVLELDVTRGPIVFYVTGQVRGFRGQLTGSNIGGQLLLAYVGTSRVELDTAFRGTVVAPQAIVDLRRPPVGKQMGTFFGKEVHVQSNALVELEPFVSMDCLAGTGCSGHGTCRQGTGSRAFDCQCTEEWVGDKCEINRPILPAHPTQTWSVPSPSGEVFQQVGTAADGDVLASTQSSVLRIASSGASTLVGSIPPGQSATLDTKGMGYALKADASVTLYDRAGTALVDTAVSADDYVKVFPGAQRMMVASVRTDLYSSLVTGATAIGPGFTAVLDAPGIVLSRLSNNQVHYTNGLQTVQLTQSGSEVTRRDVPLRDLEVDDTGSRMIGEIARRGTALVHVTNGVVGDTLSLDTPLWDLAMSPDGIFSAATWQTGVHVFATGKLQGSYALPLSVATRVAVSERGETLVGGKTADGKAIVLLLARNGSELWRYLGDTETHPYRPDVRFFPQGDAFVIRSASALTAYTISRSP